jgi:hypothetical protein
LTVIHHAPEESLAAEDAREWLGTDVAAVMEKGLGALDNSRLRQLLVRPALLPAIQELVLIEGGVYWNALMPPTPRRMPLTPTATQKPSLRWIYIVVPLAVAASLAAFIAVDLQREPVLQPGIPASDLTVTRGADTSPAKVESRAHQPWGWNRDDMLDVDIGTTKLSAHLANTLNDWFEVTANDGSDLDALRLHLSEMWAGCQQVLAQTPDITRPELKQKVHECVSQLEERMQKTLQTLHQPPANEAAAETAARVKMQVDAWIRETADALREME